MLLVTFIFLLFTLKEIVPLLKFKNKVQPELNRTKPALYKLRTRIIRVRSMFKKFGNNVMNVLPVIFFLHAIKADYDKHEENGIKQYSDSTKNVLKERQKQQQIAKIVQKQIVKK